MNQIFESSASIHGFVTAELGGRCWGKSIVSDKNYPAHDWMHSIPTIAAYGGKEICLFNLKAMANGRNGHFEIAISPVISNHVCRDWIMDVR